MVDPGVKRRERARMRAGAPLGKTYFFHEWGSGRRKPAFEEWEEESSKPLVERCATCYISLSPPLVVFRGALPENDRIPPLRRP